jgi:hypothetical protein
MAAGDGLVIMTPTSITHAGTSASINSDGGVDFTAVTSLSLNGVFTSSFDNYLIITKTDVASGNVYLSYRLRVSGSDASASNYAYQSLFASSTTISAGRGTSATSADVHYMSDSLTDGFHLHVYGPFLTQPTAWRSVAVSSASNAAFNDLSGTHSLSTSYDGFTFIPASSNVTGNVVVLGYEE